MDHQKPILGIQLVKETTRTERRLDILQESWDQENKSGRELKPLTREKIQNQLGYREVQWRGGKIRARFSKRSGFTTRDSMEIKF